MDPVKHKIEKQFFIKHNYHKILINTRFFYVENYT